MPINAMLLCCRPPPPPPLCTSVLVARTHARTYACAAGAIAALKAGETVLDLGSGAGFDCSLAARKVGPTGHVIGVRRGSCPGA